MGVLEEVGASCRLTKYRVGGRRTHMDNGTLLVWKTLRKCLECHERWEAMKECSWQVLKLY